MISNYIQDSVLIVNVLGGNIAQKIVNVIKNYANYNEKDVDARGFVSN